MRFQRSSVLFLYSFMSFFVQLRVLDAVFFALLRDFKDSQFWSFYEITMTVGFIRLRDFNDVCFIRLRDFGDSQFCSVMRSQLRSGFSVSQFCFVMRFQ